MSNFDHYHDMDHDGDHDLKDSGMFHDMEEYHGKVQPAGEDEFYQFAKGLLIGRITTVGNHGSKGLW